MPIAPTIRRGDVERTVRRAYEAVARSPRAKGSSFTRRLRLALVEIAKPMRAEIRSRSASRSSILRRVSRYRVLRTRSGDQVRYYELLGVEFGNERTVEYKILRSVFSRHVGSGTGERRVAARIARALDHAYVRDMAAAGVKAVLGLSQRR